MSETALRKLDEQFCFTLYSASMAVGRAYKPLLDRLGITYPQYLVLNALWERDGISLGTVAETLALESSTVTPLVKRLEAAGLVQRRRNPEDERQVIVALTEAGRGLQARCVCLAERLVAVSGMPLDRLMEIAREVRSVRDAMGDGMRRGDEARPAPEGQP